MSIALLFPGQGSQEPGMGRALAEADREIMDLWKKAERISKRQLRGIYWDGAEADMAETANLQPALTVANLALWRRLAPGCKAAAVAGHSLGEYSALAAAEVLPEDTVLELVSLRGRLMSEADPESAGAMAAVLKLPLEKVQECVSEAQRATGEMILIANYNTPAQFVVSGTRTAIAAVQEKVREAKGRAVVLAVSGAFHSPMMEEAAAELAAAINAVPAHAWSKAAFPVYCNADPTPHSDAGRIRALLQAQMTSPVRWITTVTGQWDAGCRLFVECGPKGVLSKMVGPILQSHAPAKAAHSDDHPAWNALSVDNDERARSFASGVSA